MTFKCGYIALVSVIIISSILLLALFEDANINYLARFSILQSEKREQSAALARGCLQLALVRLAENPEYRPDANGDILKVGNDSCQIISINTNMPQELLIKTSANKDHNLTTLLSSVNFTGTSISIISMQEI